MKATRIATLAIMVWAFAGASAQALWTSAEAKLQIAKKINISAEADWRSHDHFQKTERMDFAITADYRLLPWLKAGAGYVYIAERSLTEVTRKGNIIPPYWNDKNRGIFALTGSMKIGRLELSLREQYQLTRRSEKLVPKFDSDGDPKPDELISAKTRHKLRSRLQGEYKIPKCPFTPYASAELYNNLDRAMSFNIWRLTAGCDYKINKRNTFTLYYRYIYGSDRDEADANNILGVGYTYKFKL